MGWWDIPAPAYPAELNAADALLDRWATSAPDRTALHHADGTWTYLRLFETANRIAHVLVDDCGLIPGGRVLLRAPNNPMLVACWFAVLKAGGVAVTTMPLLRVRELAEIIERADVQLALTDATVAADLEAALAKRAGAKILQFNTTDSAALDALAGARSSHFATVPTAADDPAIIAFTSGTTGRAKGTIHAHRDLLATADSYGRHLLALQPDDICIGSPPLAFTYGLGGLVLFPMRVGASAALLEQATPPKLLEGIQRFRATTTFTSPTGYRAMLELVRDFDLTSLRKCISAGETLPAATFDAWLNATGIRLMDGIGSTEMLHMFIASPAEQCRPGSTGRVVPGYKAVVIDDLGHEVAPGTIGRLAVRGPTGCRYLDDLENQRKYVQHEWNVTGDAYYVDEEGYFWYQSRTDDMIISGGYNISGVEVENVLLMHPAVAECAVVGVPDAARGQLVKAFVVAGKGAPAAEELARTLQEYVKSQLAPYKYPRALEFVDELPRTLSGKLQRFRLRESDPIRSRPMSHGVESHEPEGWPRPSGYSNAVSATGRTVFVSGQVGWDPVTSKFPDGGFIGQVRQALTNVVTALAAAGAAPNQITRMTWYVTDRDEYLEQRAQIGAEYRQIIGRHFPAMTLVVVKGLWEQDAEVEIEATAVVP